MLIRSFPAPMFATNCWVIAPAAGGECIIVDPGMPDISADIEMIIEESKLKPVAAFITHGHLDHCGWLPKLVNDGFRGKIFCTSPTKEIARVILYDSAKIQEEEAQRANKEKYSKHEPAIPLYTVDDVNKVIPLFRVVDLDLDITITDDIYFSFFYA